MLQLHELFNKIDSEFIVFSQTICPYCDLAERTLKNNNLTFEVVNLDYEGDLRSKIVKETGHRTVPMIFDLRGRNPVFVGGSDNLLDYL
ncbi:MAG: glutaredoxin [Euryarchaeota archaeon]|nr:glutaredoxin [Euryarchaeota archaeon]